MRSRRIVFVLVLVLVAFHAVTLRNGALWGGSGVDLGKSIVHGLNIIEGRNFFDTSAYVNAGTLAHQQPRTYPVLYSLLQGALFAWTELDHYFVVAKLVLIAFLGIVLFFLARWALERDGPLVAGLTVALFGLLPALFEFKEQVRSEFPFMAGIYFLLWRLDRDDETARERSSRAAFVTEALVIGVVLYGLVAVRSVGVVVLAALPLRSILNRRLPRLATIAAIGIAAALYLAQSFFVGGVPEQRYAGEFASSAPEATATILTNLNSYRWALETFLMFPPGSADRVSLVVAALTFALALAGYVGSLVRGLRARRLGLAEIVVPAYFAVVLLHNTGSAWERYLLPIMPLFFFYALHGLRALADRIVKRHTKFAVVAFGAAILVMYASVYATSVSFSTFATGPLDPRVQRIHAAIAAMTDPDEVIVSREYVWTHLLTGRVGAAMPSWGCCEGESGDTGVRDYLRDSGANYLLANEAPRTRIGLNYWDSEDFPPFRDWLARNPKPFTEIAREDSFVLYRIDRDAL
ncbi:MAG: hypothetical protein WD673_05825 [Alphaproteobacteria bacterium]